MVHFLLQRTLLLSSNKDDIWQAEEEKGRETLRMTSSNNNLLMSKSRCQQQGQRKAVVAVKKSASTAFPHPLLFLFFCCCFVSISLFPAAEAMPLQMLRMYSSQRGIQGPSHHMLLSRQLRSLGNAYLAEEGAKIHRLQQQQQQQNHYDPLVAKRTPSEFEIFPEMSASLEEENSKGRNLLLNPAEEVRQKEQEKSLPLAEQGEEEVTEDEDDDDDSAVLAAAAAAGLLRQERNDANAAAPKMYARHIGDLGGTMFRFG